MKYRHRYNWLFKFKIKIIQTLFATGLCLSLTITFSLQPLLVLPHKRLILSSRIFMLASVYRLTLCLTHDVASIFSVCILFSSAVFHSLHYFCVLLLQCCFSDTLCSDTACSNIFSSAVSYRRSTTATNQVKQHIHNKEIFKFFIHFLLSLCFLLTLCFICHQSLMSSYKSPHCFFGICVLN